MMEPAPHEQDIAGKVNPALKMGEDAFFGILARVGAPSCDDDAVKNRHD
jgi:hypothetical protein